MFGNVFQILYMLIGKMVCCLVVLMSIITVCIMLFSEPIAELVNNTLHVLKDGAQSIPTPER